MGLPDPLIEDDHGLQKTLKEICDDAVEMAEELIERLDKLKLRDRKFQVRNTGSSRSPE
jgi:hypothetical protein